MAKKITKTFQEQLQGAKSFHEMIDMVEAKLKENIHNAKQLLKKRDKFAKSRRPRVQEEIERGEIALAYLGNRRQRFESIQGNKKIPAAYRKKAAELEKEIVTLEHGSSSREGELYYRKKDLSELLKRIDERLNPPEPQATVNAAYKVGKQYVQQSLINAYDEHVWYVLEGYVQRLPRVKGQQKKFEILALLPGKPEYLQMKEKHFRTTIELLTREAYKTVSEIRGDVEDAYEDGPEEWQETDNGQALIDIAAQLDDIERSLPFIPDAISSLQIVRYPSLTLPRLYDRAGEAADILRDVSVAVEEFLKASPKLQKIELKMIQEFCNQLEEHANEVADMEFPELPE
jgi:tetratricopeptide (TPR) repeat protein